MKKQNLTEFRKVLFFVGGKFELTNLKKKK